MREKRRHQRTTYIVPVQVQLPDGEVVHAQSQDLSVGGVFLQAEMIPALGTAVVLSFELTGCGWCSLPGFVRWIKDGGYGVQFGLLGARETHAMGKLVRAGSVGS